MDEVRLHLCRNKLVELARVRKRISYGELAAILGVANQAPGRFLDKIYKAEMDAGRPDLTLVVVYKGTQYGRYNSQGAKAKSIKVDTGNQEHVRLYEEGLAQVFEYWSTQRGI